MKYNELVLLIDTPYFEKGDFRLGEKTIYNYQLTQWVKKKYLIKLRNSIYAFAREIEKVQGEEIASLLYQPSYISMESALAYYGFIPEMVYAFISVTSKTNRVFDNDLGHFIYRHVKPELFWGYREILTDTGHYLIAEPEKAVLDYLYLNLSKINNADDFDNLRFNAHELEETLNREKFYRYAQAFGKKKLDKWSMKCLP